MKHLPSLRLRALLTFDAALKNLNEVLCSQKVKGGMKSMPQSERDSFEICISNAALSIAYEFGLDEVKSVFHRYDADGFDDLQPVYYSDVLNDLEMRLEGI